jgi:virginiamycin B lyase
VPRRLIPSLLGLLAAAALAPAAARATPAVAGEFPLGQPPGPLMAGPDGNMWVVLAGRPNDITMVTPAGAVTGYAAASISSPGGVAADASGNLWVTQIGGVARFAPASPTAATSYPVAAIGSSPQAIVLGPDGNLWTASRQSVIQIPPSNPAGAKTFSIPGMVNAVGIAAGGDGNLYVADAGGQLVRVTTAGVATVYPVGTEDQGVVGVTGGIGQQIAFTQEGSLGGMYLQGTFAAPQSLSGTPMGIAVGADQAYWIADASAASLTRLTAAAQSSTLPGFSAGSAPQYVAAGPNGTLWVSLAGSNRIGLVTGLQPPSSPVVPQLMGLPAGGGSSFYRTTVTPRTITHGGYATLNASVLAAASVTARVQLQTTGRRSGRRCIAQTPRNRGARACVLRAITRQTVRANVVPAGQGIATARLGGPRLPPGRYSIVVTAGNAVANASSSLRLTVVARPPRRRGAR